MLSAVRQDAWNHDDDLVLAEVVLRHIREGGTQLAAFEEVAERLSRTSAACGFRWNSLVRKNYQSAIELAKKQRKQLKKQLGQNTEQEDRPKEAPSPTGEAEQAKEAPSPQTNMLSLEEVINFLKQFRSDSKYQENLLSENERLSAEIERLKKKNQHLQKEMTHIEKDHHSIQKDYQSLIGIMERARKMAVFQESEKEKDSLKGKIDGESLAKVYRR
jgi:prespore-specific regulator